MSRSRQGVHVPSVSLSLDTPDRFSAIGDFTFLVVLFSTFIALIESESLPTGILISHSIQILFIADTAEYKS